MKLNLLIIIIFIGATVGCQQGDDRSPAHPDDVILVLVDGRPVTLPMLEFLMEVRGVSEEDTAAMRGLLDELIRIRVMANAAEAEGLVERERIRAERAIKDMETLYVRYLEHFQATHPVTDQDIEQAYSEQLERSGDRQFQLETVAFGDQADALRHLARIQDEQEAFESVADRARDAGRRVTRSGWVDRSQVPLDFAVELGRTEVSEVVATPLPLDGEWYLARVIETRPLEAPALEAVRDGIRRTLTRQRNQALIDQFYEAAEITPMLPIDEVPEER